MKLLVILIVTISTQAFASDTKTNEKPYWSNLQYVNDCYKYLFKNENKEIGLFDHSQAIPGLKYLKKLNRTS